MKKITLDRLIKDIDYTIKQCENLSPLMSEVGNLVKNETELSFEKERDGFGNKWTPLSEQTLKYKKGSKILTESSTLQSSINSRTKLQQTKTNTKGSVSIGTNIEYAAVHQFGGKAGKGLKVNIPARPFLPIDDKGEIPNDLKEEIKETILKHINIK